ncbi:MAG: hypothetical protein Q7J61_04145, partial [Deltaproteobacteria bacterium]|nr:hypothetical protein [Deltaproteobacteria bacterium]
PLSLGFRWKGQKKAKRKHNDKVQSSNECQSTEVQMVGFFVIWTSFELWISKFELIDPAFGLDINLVAVE